RKPNHPFKGSRPFPPACKQRASPAAFKTALRSLFSLRLSWNDSSGVDLEVGRPRNHKFEDGRIRVLINAGIRTCPLLGRTGHAGTERSASCDVAGRA